MTISLELLQTKMAPTSESALAYDTADQLGLRLLEEMVAEDGNLLTKPLLTLGDNFGALTLGACHIFSSVPGEAPVGQVRVFQDSLLATAALEKNCETLCGSLRVRPVSGALEPQLFEGAQTVLMRLPKDLRLLDLYAQMIAAFADPDVQIIAVGKVKHMTRSMNDVFKKYFGQVKASLGWKKSRALLAASPLKSGSINAAEWKLPFTYTEDAQTGIRFASLPGVFSAGRLDIGTRFLLQNLTEQTVPEAGRAADLGSGTGAITAKLMQLRPKLDILATDVSSLAVLSTKETIELNLRMASDHEEPPSGQYKVVQADGLGECEESGLDLVVCNPPFHLEYEVTTGISEKLFRQAARALKPGGQMITVFNSHLQYRPLLERLVGPTRQLGRNAKFTLVISTVLPS